jgi:predicted secreted protein
MATRWYLGLIPVLCVPAVFSVFATEAVRQENPASHKIKVIEIDETANGRDVHLRVGDELKLTLPENRSTGYKWQLVRLPGAALHLVSDTFEPNIAPRPGSAGARYWIFKAYEAGQATIELRSKRSWEDVPSGKAFECKVVIDRLDR